LRSGQRITLLLVPESPFSDSSQCGYALGKCRLFLGHVDEALNFFRRAQAANPRVWWVRLKLAGTLGLLAKTDEAMAEAAEMTRLKPKMNSVTRIRNLKWYPNPQFQELHDKTIILGLRTAGFPEETQRAEDSIR
jgi:tetratricopeptide (TPR) repeat protein